MWKSVFLALGIFSCIVGVELLLVESATVIPLQGGPPRTMTAPDWAPWALISIGAVTILHFCTLPVKQPPPGGQNWRGLNH
ncbi:MAG: hypothetical protein ACK6CT_01750 [Planctomycetia bacterium]|jgi:hypothetical protein